MTRDKRRRKKEGRTSAVTYIFNDEGRKSRRRVHIPRGTRLLRNVIYSHGETPKRVRGKEVHSWVYVYSADDQCADKYSPVVWIRRRKVMVRKAKSRSLIDKILRWF